MRFARNPALYKGTVCLFWCLKTDISTGTQSIVLKALHTGYVLTLSKRKILDLNKLFEIDPFKQQQGQTLLLLSDPPSSLPTASLSESGPQVLIFLKFPVVELKLCCNLQRTCWHLTAL